MVANFEPGSLVEISNVLLEVAKKAGEMITGAKPVVEGAGSKKNCTLSTCPSKVALS